MVAVPVALVAAKAPDEEALAVAAVLVRAAAAGLAAGDLLPSHSLPIRFH